MQVDEKTPQAIVGSQALGFHPQPDVSDPSAVTMESVRGAIARLPALPTVAPVPQDAAPQILLEDEVPSMLRLRSWHIGNGAGSATQGARRQLL